MTGLLLIGGAGVVYGCLYLFHCLKARCFGAAVGTALLIALTACLYWRAL